MVIQLVLLNGFLPAILINSHRHHALDVHCFQYGMKIVQGHTTFFCSISPHFCLQTESTSFLFALFNLLKTDSKANNQALFTFSFFTLVGISFFV
jgi:hypothetical protein